MYTLMGACVDFWCGRVVSMCFRANKRVRATYCVCACNVLRVRMQRIAFACNVLRVCVHCGSSLPHLNSQRFVRGLSSSIHVRVTAMSGIDGSTLMVPQ